jgi:4-diphosphocytidyl-2-C-methyl-D-erythritol kinase
MAAGGSVSGTLLASCPAKINLSLRVLGRRADGYHEIETVYQAVDLWDELEADVAETLLLDCDAPGVPTDGSNLVLRAATALRAAAGRLGAGASLRLRKAIPAGGGMGGGSSNAAGALLLLRRLWRLELPDSELVRIGVSLGSDVPFFLVGGTALGTGRGEEVRPLPFAGERPLVLGFPPFGVPTAEVYRRLSARLTHPGNSVSLSRLSTHKSREKNDFGSGGNDLEAVVFEGWPELQGFRDALLRAGAVRALLSGSGSSVVGIFGDGGEAERAAEALRERFRRWQVRPSRTLADGIRLAEA